MTDIEKDIQVMLEINNTNIEKIDSTIEEGVIAFDNFTLDLYYLYKYLIELNEEFFSLKNSYKSKPIVFRTLLEITVKFIFYSETNFKYSQWVKDDIRKGNLYQKHNPVVLNNLSNSSVYENKKAKIHKFMQDKNVYCDTCYSCDECKKNINAYKYEPCRKHKNCPKCGDFTTYKIFKLVNQDEEYNVIYRYMCAITHGKRDHILEWMKQDESHNNYKTDFINNCSNYQLILLISLTESFVKFMGKSDIRKIP